MVLVCFRREGSWQIQVFQCYAIRMIMTCLRTCSFLQTGGSRGFNVSGYLLLMILYPFNKVFLKENTLLANLVRQQSSLIACTGLMANSQETAGSLEGRNFLSTLGWVSCPSFSFTSPPQIKLEVHYPIEDD